MVDWTHVQGAFSTTVGTPPTLGVPVTNGNIAVGGFLVNTGINLDSCTDDKGNQYFIVAAGDDLANWAFFGVMPAGLITNGPTQLIPTFSSTPTNIWGAVTEFAPPTGTTAISLDGTTWFQNGSLNGQAPTTSLTSPATPFQTIHNDTLLYCFMLQSAAVTAGSGWSVDQQPGNDLNTFYKIATTAGSANQFTLGTATGSQWGVVFGIAPVARTTWMPVQRKFVPASSGTTITITLPNPITPGNMVTSGFGAISGSLVSILDNLGRNYTANVLNNDSTEGHCIWWSGGLLSTAPQTFTITSSVGGNTAATIVEWAPPPGTASVAVDGGGAVRADYFTTPAITTLATPSITTTHSGDLIYSWISSGGSLGDVPLNGFNMLNNWNIKNSDSYWIQGAAGSIAPAWDFAASQGVLAFGVAFNAVPSGGAGAAEQTIFTNPQSYGFKL